MAHVKDLWTIPNPSGRGRIKGPRHGSGRRWLASWVEAGGARRSKTFDTKDAAVAHLEQVGHEQRAGTYVSPASARATFVDVAERWYAEQVHQRASTLQVIRRRLDRTILPAFTGYRWDEISRATVQATITKWTRDLAPSTVRVAYVYLAGICQLAVDERRIATTPCTRINLPTVAHELVVPLTVAQVQALTDSAGAEHRGMFVLGAASGMRSSEMRGLTWDRVRPVADGGAVVRVDRQLLRASTSMAPSWGPPKTISSVRNVAIGPATVAALGEPGEGLVFRSRRGGAVVSSGAWTIWREAAKRAGVESSGWHDLRHFHASLLIAGGASPVAVAHRLGHKDATETLQTYAHLWPDDDERMRDATDGLVLATRSS
ncbi:tyrosine-type recombinase/integrase [Litorihabitans aurantiacus]|uniref:Site-specific integrase n=1 Tax=Litorihabitans aurantiacus TaxID=1930061 RepID=A0AA37XEA8_9MICO|nr:site-specific integrase [Litorihabitans aurantiacus]GMA31564.1 site-specific integrase [Litorihabitans aurantiacus]